jgi:hypothetical protein
LFGWIAGFQILLAVFVVYRMRVSERVPESERIEFVESLNEIQRVFHSDSPPPEPEAPEPESEDGDDEK